MVLFDKMTKRLKDPIRAGGEGIKTWDVAIIGSGPAGLTAAIYATRGAASTIVLAGEAWGGQLMLTTIVDNYPALPGISGPELMQKMRDHALKFGAELVAENLTAVDFSKLPFKLTTNKQKLTSKSVIIATGAQTLWLGVPGEDKLRGRGVSSCAPCDAPFFKGKKVAVIGGGDSAMEEALVLTKYANSVTVIHRRSEFRASAIMQKKVFEEKKIKVVWDSIVEEFLGEDKLQRIRIRNIKEGESKEIEFDGVFITIGYTPSTEIFEGQVELDEKGYIVRNSKLRSEISKLGEYRMSTTVPGVFVAGDVHDYHYRQAITAAGFGCMAAMDALRYLEGP